MPAAPKRSYTIPAIGLLSAFGLISGSYIYSSTKEAKEVKEVDEVKEINDFNLVLKKANSFGTLEEERETISYLKKQLEYYEKKEGEKSIRVSIILFFLGRHCFAASGDKTEAIKYGERSCEMLFESGMIALFVKQMDALIEMVLKASPEEAARLEEKFLQYSLQLSGDQLASMVSSHLTLGGMIQDPPENKERSSEWANKHLDRAKLFLEKLEKSNKYTFELEFTACLTFHEAKRYKDSDVYCKKVIERLRDSKAKNDGSQLSQNDLKIEYYANANLTMNAFSEGDLLKNDELILQKTEEGLRYAQRADEILESWSERSGEYYLEKANNKYRLGMGFFKKQDYDQAIMNWKHSQDACEHLEPEHRYSNILRMKMMITEAYARMGDDEKITESAKETLEFLTKENIRL